MVKPNLMKKTIKSLLIFLAALVIILPLYLTKNSLSFSTPTEALFSTHKLLGLFAFSLIFLQIVMGSGRQILGKVFNQATVLKTHIKTGHLAFCAAILHPILLYSTYLTEKNLSIPNSFQSGESIIYYYMGVLAWTLLFISVLAAIFRFKIGPKWIYLHRINYLIFWLAFFHSLKIGLDTQTLQAQIIYIIYGSIVAALTLRKIVISLKIMQTKNTQAPKSNV